MSVHPIDALPDEAHVWVFGTNRPLAGEETALLRDRFPPFLEEWTAHRRELRAAWELREDRFVIVAVDEASTAASGCSIDALMRHLRGLEEALQVGLLDSTPIWYRNAEGEIVAVTRAEFRLRAGAGEVDVRTAVFDPTLATLGELRAGRLELPAGEAWHARLLPADTTATPGPASP